jgi:hypothetical protein
MMANLTRRLLIPLIAWTAIVACWILGMHIWLRNMSVGPEEKQVLFFSSIVGCVVVLLCWPFCRVLHRIPSASIGFVMGLAVPIIASWIWGRLPEYSPGLPWSFVEAWSNGLQLAIPSSIGGVVVGILQAKRVIHSSAEPGSLGSPP